MSRCDLLDMRPQANQGRSGIEALDRGHPCPPVPRNGCRASGGRAPAMISALCLLISLAILIFILRYRVHVHVHYEAPRKAKAQAVRHSQVRARGDNAKNPETDENGGRVRRPDAGRPVRLALTPQSAPAPSPVEEIVSALRGLGCAATAARAATQQALASGPQDFESVLRRAIQIAHRKEAA